MLSMWAEKILRKEGQNPNYPRVLLAAPTGKAASIIGKFHFHNFLGNLYLILSFPRWYDTTCSL